MLGRLTEHKFNNSYNEQLTTEHFAFDPASNRVSVQTVDDIAEKAFAHHGRPSELIQNNQRIRYVYDTHGRVRQKAIAPINASDGASSVDLQLHYNANNELKRSVRVEHKDTQITETQTTYYYDAFGRRITKYSEVNSRTQNKEQAAKVSTIQYEYILWDGDLPIQAYNNRQIYTTVYDQGSFVPVARLMWLRDDLSEVANDDFNQINHEQDSSAIRVYHYHNDQLGTPNELTNEKGEVVWLADYEAWGNTAKVICHEQMIGNIQVSQNELQPIRFQGQHFDEETGLHYNHFRYYDPDMGMFTSRDPIELMGGNNVFQYAPNPTEWVDPLGLRTVVHRQPVLRTTQSPSRGYDKENVAAVNRGMNVLKCGGLFTPPCSVKNVCTEYRCPNDPPDNQCTAMPKNGRLIPDGMTYEEVGCVCIKSKLVKEEDMP